MHYAPPVARAKNLVRNLAVCKRPPFLALAVPFAVCESWRSFNPSETSFRRFVVRKRQKRGVAGGGGGGLCKVKDRCSR